ncbi:hypothetical protein ABFS82_05G003500 [Erythranthe guttata]|uniref:RING-type E3 ubiquitin transferase n=1 Tax=Erythranthe guttata TaxID=4155 RepID=A0A022RQ29_ERYGU|nr:PREDICTED: E3 ubiquitin-protein ligase At3g02290-like [Erythranthe guttata]XP_012831694.1 PREDICTED: E3 ubiquitin-protein ligase At3g02290-like [Erythranthe guttata]EYU42111.1 hypothetical protein MIMGU_mgv1a013786mg [Erythranthe guttata]|eukprot:XP_012831693.1 PREDICTED: E3 ubiquitin-protein ligase At3g02290-like [Erythranthe guttata]
MGALCCCFRVHDVQDDDSNNSSNNSSPDNCLCPKSFFSKLLSKKKATSPPSQHASSSNTEVVSNSSSHSSGAHNAASSESASARLLQEEQSDGSRGRQEKGNSRSRVQPEPAGQSGTQINPKSTGEGKIVISVSEVEVQERKSQSSKKVELSFPSLREVEECPTCLEEYTEENPKIIAKCSHHYHLSCIYEWMERSHNCPVCRELMLFDE